MKVTEDMSPGLSNSIQQVSPNQHAQFPLRMFFGHHKCATGWIDHILREICLHMGLSFKIVHQPYSFKPYGTLGPLVKDQRIQFLSYINTNIKYTQDLKVFKAFHVVRDPRDIVVSAYYSHLHSLKAPSWKTLQDVRAHLQKLPKEDALFFELDFLSDQFEEMAAWNYEQDHILELKMEDISADPLRSFEHILKFLDMYDEKTWRGIGQRARALRLSMNRWNHKGRRYMPGKLPMFPVPKRPVHHLPGFALEQITKKLSFKKLAGGRTKGEENVNSHYRKGVHGDWKNHFNEEHINYFKIHYNDLLIQLGYEFDDKW